MTTFIGPTTMPCAQQCEVPEGVRIAWVPPPRHDWGDVVRCPNDECGRAFLVLDAGQVTTNSETSPGGSDG